jgi:hypothetical protein
MLKWLELRLTAAGAIVSGAAGYSNPERFTA